MVLRVVWLAVLGQLGDPPDRIHEYGKYNLRDQFSVLEALMKIRIVVMSLFVGRGSTSLGHTPQEKISDK
jgi:hypothetical protein